MWLEKSHRGVWGVQDVQIAFVFLVNSNLTIQFMICVKMWSLLETWEKESMQKAWTAT